MSNTGTQIKQQIIPKSTWR